jgi:putative transposase
MKFVPKIHSRHSIRLNGFDYSGEVIDNHVRLSVMGEIVKKCLDEIPKHFLNAELDNYVIMPNHVHGILFLKDALVRVEYIQPPPRRVEPAREVKRNEFQHVVPKSVGSVIRSFKAAVTRICRKNGSTAFAWQRDYYDHIIRDGHDLDRIRQYILDNPANWVNDDNQPRNIQMDQTHEGIVDCSPLD